MTRITTDISDKLNDNDKNLIEELGGEIISESKSTRKAVLKELEEAFNEAKEIRDGKKEALTLEQIFLGE